METEKAGAQVIVCLSDLLQGALLRQDERKGLHAQCPTRYLGVKGSDDVAVTDTTPPPGEQIWRLVNVTELSPGAYRALLACLGLRRLEEDQVSVFSDLCLCEIEDLRVCEAAYRFAEERCGARIPLVIHGGPPARFYAHLKDLGSLSSWYFRAVERIHG